MLLLIHWREVFVGLMFSVLVSSEEIQEDATVNRKYDSAILVARVEVGYIMSSLKHFVVKMIIAIKSLQYNWLRISLVAMTAPCHEDNALRCSSERRRPGFNSRIRRKHFIFCTFLLLSHRVLDSTQSTAPVEDPQTIRALRHIGQVGYLYSISS